MKEDKDFLRLVLRGPIVGESVREIACPRQYVSVRRLLLGMRLSGGQKRVGLCLFVSMCVVYYQYSIALGRQEQIELLEEKLDELKRNNAQRALREQKVYEAQSVRSPSLHIPSISDLYPHLFDVSDLSMLNPAVKVPEKELKQVKLVIGVPAVERPQKAYLETTLSSLIFRAVPAHLNDIRIVVMLSHVNGSNAQFVRDTIRDLSEKFKEHLESGLIQIIVPPTKWFPLDLSEIPPTFGDSKERMFWRTKQNLDYVYLMAFSLSMGRYYMQLEDDVEAAARYTENIFNAVDKSHEWQMLEFSTLGCIGKLMRSSLLTELNVYILLNYRFKPIDWLLSDFFANRFCTPEMNARQCTKGLHGIRRHIKPSLFQHIGLYSSLPGKIQKLRDRSFPRNKMTGLENVGARGVTNPSAVLNTSMTHYLRYNLESAYTRQAKAWLINPQKDDFVVIQFTPAVRIKAISFSTGTPDHPTDQFRNETSVHVRRMGDQDFVHIGTFNVDGSFDYTVDKELHCEYMKLQVNADLPHWALISDITILTK